MPVLLITVVAAVYGKHNRIFREVSSAFFSSSLFSLLFYINAERASRSRSLLRSKEN